MNYKKDFIRNTNLIEQLKTEFNNDFVRVIKDYFNLSTKILNQYMRNEIKYDSAEQEMGNIILGIDFAVAKMVEQSRTFGEDTLKASERNEIACLQKSKQPFSTGSLFS